MITVQETVQERIDAQEALDAIVYGQRTLKAMGGREYGITEEWGAADWAIAQWDAAKVAAAEAGETLDGTAAAWCLAKAKKAAQARLKAAKAAEAAIGTKRQLRLALAA